MLEKDSLKNKTISALFYSFSGFIAQSGVQFVFAIILARLLLPQDYGILGMTIIFLAISQIFIDGGMTTALIREKEVSEEDYSTVFYYNFAIAVIIYCILFISAPAISNFFREPILLVIIRVLSLNIIIGSIGLIQRTILVRKLNFKTQTKIDVIALVLAGILAIILAYNGFGVWSLVINGLAKQLISSSLLVAYNKWTPLLVFDFNSFKKLFGFGWKMMVTGILSTIYNNVYNIIIGRFYLATMLGYYTKSLELRDAAANSITSSVAKVSYPALSKLQDDHQRFKAGFKRIIKNSSFLTFPMMIGLAAVANQLIQLLFGTNWLPMVPYFQILCLSGMTLPHRALNLNILQVKGRSDLFLKLDILKMVIGLIFISVVIILNLGIYGLLWTTFLNAQIALIVNSHYSKELISYSTKEQIIDMIPTVIISIIMGILVFAVGGLLPFSNAIILPIQVITGVTIYVIISKLARIKEFDTVYQLTKQMFQKMWKRLTV
ncbi:MAG: lipopolysaccharide biosynthesis protein [Gracilibacter sp. BRH_c7a]|nr:MAG: lipopolysaccharide biosynthesis protein [Gracilibacter sp. BRH_c7a]